MPICVQILGESGGEARKGNGRDSLARVKEEGKRNKKHLTVLIPMLLFQFSIRCL